MSLLEGKAERFRYYAGQGTPLTNPDSPSRPLAEDQASLDRLFATVYEELRRIASREMRRERSGHTLQPTAVVHEAYARLQKQRAGQVYGRERFLAEAALAMRRVLVDHARRRAADKRCGGWRRITLDGCGLGEQDRAIDFLALDEGLGRLAETSPRRAKVVELRYFGGLASAEVARHLGVSLRTVQSEWKLARAWLHRELSEGR